LVNEAPALGEVMVEVGGPPCDDKPANKEPGTTALVGPSNGAPQGGILETNRAQAAGCAHANSSIPEGHVRVTVGNATKEFDFRDIDSIWQIPLKMHEVFGFMKDNLVTQNDQREIEYAAINGMLSTLDPHSWLLKPESYNRMFSLHGIIMVWFFLIPSIPTVFGNFLIPMMIGARDLAFPRLNLASWYIFALGGLFTILVSFLGGVDTGWTFYTPYSTTYSNSYVLLTATGVFITGFSSIFTGINFIITIHKMRAPGLTAIFVKSAVTWKLPAVIGFFTRPPTIHTVSI
jgi:hypothetical protein